MKKLFLITILLLILGGFAMGAISQKITCDYCNRESTGFDNWYRLSISSGVVYPEEPSAWDFCCLEHLKLWIEKNKEEEL